jgi:hypothetical protein
MERLARQERERSGITRQALRLWGLLFVMAGILGRSVLQHRLLNMGSVSSQELLEAMMASEQVMVYATLALIMQAVEACAIPIFAVLLVDGVQHTKNLGKYFLRVLGVAAVSELPYNLAMSGSLWDASTRNPAFGLVLSLVILLIFKRFEGKGFGKLMIKFIVIVAGIVWTVMLGIVEGQSCVVLVAALWAARNQKQFRSFVGCVAAACCSLFSPFYLAAPMGFMAVHFYQGEQGEENRIINYGAYPVLLLIAGIAGTYLM